MPTPQTQPVHLNDGRAKLAVVNPQQQIWKLLLLLLRFCDDRLRRGRPLDVD